MRKWKYLLGLLGMVVLLIVAGCQNNRHQAQGLHGAYKVSQASADLDNQGNLQPDYWYFKKNGKLMWAEPETGDSEHGNYGSAGRGTWRALGNDKYRIHVEYLYSNSDPYTFTVKKTGNRLHAYDSEKNSWNNYRQPQMTYSDFISMFNRARQSAQQWAQKDGDGN